MGVYNYLSILWVSLFLWIESYYDWPFFIIFWLSVVSELQTLLRIRDICFRPRLLREPCRPRSELTLRQSNKPWTFCWNLICFILFCFFTETAANICWEQPQEGWFIMTQEPKWLPWTRGVALIQKERVNKVLIRCLKLVCLRRRDLWVDKAAAVVVIAITPKKNIPQEEGRTVKVLTASLPLPSRFLFLFFFLSKRDAALTFVFPPFWTEQLTPLVNTM